jgi:hypothetical protein
MQLSLLSGRERIPGDHGEALLHESQPLSAITDGGLTIQSLKFS